MATRGHRMTEEQRMALPPPRPRSAPEPLPLRPFGEEHPPYRSGRIDAEGLDMARKAALLANCTRRKVGAAVYNTQGWYIGRGWNGAAQQLVQCEEGGCPRGELSTEELPAYSDYSSGPGLCTAVHAEVRAVMSIPPRARVNCTVYVTDRPCQGCFNVLYESGAHRVVWPEGERFLR